MEKLQIREVTKDTDFARISVIGIEDKPGMAYKLFSLLAREKINIDLILQSIGREDTKDISFTVRKADLNKTVDVINRNLRAIGARDLNHSDKYAKISIAGTGVDSNPGVASRMFEALYDADVNIHMISTSDTRISVLVEKQLADIAVSAIQENFKLVKSERME